MRAGFERPWIVKSTATYRQLAWPPLDPVPDTRATLVTERLRLSAARGGVPFERSNLSMFYMKLFFRHDRYKTEGAGGLFLAICAMADKKPLQVPRRACSGPHRIGTHLSSLTSKLPLQLSTSLAPGR